MYTCIRSKGDLNEDKLSLSRSLSLLKQWRHPKTVNNLDNDGANGCVKNQSLVLIGSGEHSQTRQC